MNPVDLRIEGIRHTAGGRALLDDVHLSASPGETLGVVGPNGSGKTTLLRVLHGVLRPERGRVLLDGVDTRTLGARDTARRLAAVPQSADAAGELTLREVVAMGRSPHRRFWETDRPEDHARVAAALDRTDLAHLADRPFGLLSGGERQRGLVARALAQDPGLITLDEPTNHLDIRHRLDLLALVRDLPTTVLLVLHDLNLAAWVCDRVAVLHEGRIVARGTPAEVLTPELLAEVYQVRAQVTVHPVTGAPHLIFLP
ncbi:ABC transporter ATP-binding protein [Streptomyces sp. BI20]|uniref:ABC transporter ATP-binding protein n=1 Tax=Streptomyces sp. BI20 TaxID=3403460 RepID=UPI003C778FF2